MSNQESLFEQVEEMKKLSDFLEDDEVDAALNLIMTLIRKPDAPSPKRAAEAVVKIQALSAKFAVMANVYRGVGYSKTPESRHRKDAYYTLKEALDKLADAAKYLAKTY